jgi:hypothetical protein
MGLKTELVRRKTGDIRTISGIGGHRGQGQMGNYLEKKSILLMIKGIGENIDPI